MTFRRGQINACAKKLIKTRRCMKYVTIKILGHHHNIFAFRKFFTCILHIVVLEFWNYHIIEYLCQNHFSFTYKLWFWQSSSLKHLFDWFWLLSHALTFLIYIWGSCFSSKNHFERKWICFKLVKTKNNAQEVVILPSAYSALKFKLSSMSLILSSKFYLQLVVLTHLYW